MRANTRMVRLMEPAPTSGMMKEPTMGSGRMGRCMEREQASRKMDKSTWGSIKTMKEMAMGSADGPMVFAIRGSG